MCAIVIETLTPLVESCVYKNVARSRLFFKIAERPIVIFSCCNLRSSWNDCHHCSRAVYCLAVELTKGGTVFGTSYIGTFLALKLQTESVMSYQTCLDNLMRSECLSIPSEDDRRFNIELRNDQIMFCSHFQMMQGVSPVNIPNCNVFGECSIFRC